MRQRHPLLAPALAGWLTATMLMSAAVGRAAAQAYDASPIQTALAIETTCTPDASAELRRGASLLFFVMHDEALVAFQRAAELDAGCALARWGEALALARLPAFDTTPVAFSRGRAALAAAATAPSASARDARLIAATRTLFDPAVGSAPLRMTRFGDAMHALADADPADVLALGCAVLADLARTTLPDDEPVRRARDLISRAHPGTSEMPVEVAFLRLLVADDAAADTITLATRLKTARTPTPSTAHVAARVFHRAGRWDEAIEASDTALRLAGGWLEPSLLTAPAWLGVAPEWALAAAAQRGRREQAEAVSQACATAASTPAVSIDETLPSRVAAACTRLGLRAWWADLDWQSAVPVPGPTPFAASDTAPVMTEVETEALVLLARGLYHARAAWPRGEPAMLAGARMAMQQFGVLERAHPVHARAIELDRLMVAMALAGAYESREELLVYEVQAGDLERLLDATRQRSPRLVGVDRLAGEIHLRLHDYREAREHFTSALERQPNDARALLGLARAASRMKDTAAASAAAQRFVALWASAPSRDEVVEATAVLAR